MRYSLIRIFTRAAGVLLMSPVAWAQSTTPLPPPDLHGPAMVFEEGAAGPIAEGPVGFVSFEMGLGDSVVKGAPYSAQSSVETTQVLADGNRINRKSTGGIYRDSAGRTRREQTLPAIGPFAASGNAPHVIFINDPVAGVHYALEPDQKIARKMMPPPSKADFIKELNEYDPKNWRFRYPGEQLPVVRSSDENLGIDFHSLLFNLQHTHDVLDTLDTSLIETYGQNKEWQEEQNSW